MKLTNRSGTAIHPDGRTSDGRRSDAPPSDALLDGVFQALAHPVRREILEVLREGDRTVGNLAKCFPLSRPAVSQHLDVLERAGLIQRIPTGRQNRCRFTGAPLVEAADWVLAHARYWTAAFDRLERHFVESPSPKESEP